MFVDTHTHLYSDQFNDDRDEAVQRAIELGIEKMYLPNVDSASIEGMLALESAYPENCFAMMGLHPCSVKDNYLEELKIVEDWYKQRTFKAVGEIGIDLYWDKTHFEEQKKAFLRQVALAKELKLPIVIHARESLDILIELVEEEQKGDLTGVFHCFTGDLEQAKTIMGVGFYMGIGGVLTFKKAGLDKTATDIPLESLVLETDSPYLAPSPHRGKRNESSYIHQIATKLASIKEIDLETVEKQTTENALKLFG